MTGFLMKRFGECCGSMVLTVACYWPSSNCNPAHNRCPWRSWITKVHRGVGLPTKVCAVTTLHILHQGLQTTARGTNPTCEAISSGRKIHFANNEKI